MTNKLNARTAGGTDPRIQGIVSVMSQVVAPESMSKLEVATYLAVSTKTIERWIKNRSFPARHENGKWLRSEVDDWIDAPRKSGQEEAVAG